MLIHILRQTGIEDDVDESELVKCEGVVDNDNEHTTWVEYRFPGSDVIVHRSVHVHLKQGLFAAGVAADFGTA
jgi:hypothetical protein